MDDKECEEFYKGLEKAKAKVQRGKEKNGYKIVTLACCLTCRHVERDSYESVLRCLLLGNSPDYSVNYVDEFGLCNKYIAKTSNQ